MDQKVIGNFLKKLRKEKGITQEQFAEKLNVSGRTVSRWETGSNMPDISLLVAISDFFDVSISEIINGERRSEIMEEVKEKEVAEKLSDYAEAEKELLLKRARIISIAGLISLLISLFMETISSDSMIPVYEYVEGICWGLSAGSLITMVLYTTGILAKIKEKKSKQMKKAAIICIVVITLCFIASIVASVIK